MDQDVFTLSSLTEQRDFLDVRDVVKAFGCILLQGKPGESYRTSSGTSRSLGELLEVFRRLSTVSLDTIAPRCPSNQELRLDGGRRSYAADPAIPLLDSPAEPEESPLRLLGWSPSIPFEQSITDTLHYFRNREGP